MEKITLNLSLKKKVVLKTFFILCSLILSENLFPIQHWDKNYIQVKYDNSDTTINISCQFIDYEFGPRGEHGYLEWCDFTFSYNGRDYQKLMGCLVNDQIKQDTACVDMITKLVGAKIIITKDTDPPIDLIWDNFTNILIWGPTQSYKARFKIKW